MCIYIYIFKSGRQNYLLITCSVFKSFSRIVQKGGDIYMPMVNSC